MDIYIFFPDREWWKKNRTEKDYRKLFVKVKIKDVKSKINLYKNWHLGSPHQQRSRKKSFDKNTERLPIIEGYLNLVKRMLKEYE